MNTAKKMTFLLSYNLNIVILLEKLTLGGGGDINRTYFFQLDFVVYDVKCLL